jgi:xylulose-5-phosphate/fructose-6-phosphate phosphoketolase
MNDASNPAAVTGPLSAEELRLIDAWWRAANYLSVGQIYLLDNPLLKQPLELAHIKPRLLGHWGTTPGLNFIYVHLNRIIKARDLDMIYIAGPGHGGPGIVANTWLEGTYSEIYAHVPQNARGMQRLFKQFSFPGGIPSHVAPETPGSIHEGGELGYSLSHAFGAVFDNPDLIAACVVGDGEAETGPLATSWHSNKFLNPVTDGAVLPILHLNGYKIANPTILARISPDELHSLLVGYGYKPYLVEGDDPKTMHQQMAATLDQVFDEIRAIQIEARQGKGQGRPIWPMIILKSPKGWTGPKEVDGHKTEGFWRSHQVPFAEMKGRPDHIQLLESWMKSYRPEELFDDNGVLRPEIAALAPEGERRMSANPHANGGLLMRELDLPDIADYAVKVDQPGGQNAEATAVMAEYLRDVLKNSAQRRNFRVFGPDETASNRLSHVFETTDRAWDAETLPYDDHLAPDGRVMEILSEHTCQGWLEGYLLTGRHGLFSCYEAFIHIIDSMFNQHAKWLKTCNEIPWRRRIPSLNYLLTSHVWRQDHNGFSHQDPGFIDYVTNKKAEIVRVYLPPDANSLLYVTDHCLKSWNRINVIVAGKQPAPQWLGMDEAVKHCTAGIGIWEWASNDKDSGPDVVMACAGDVPTLETAHPCRQRCRPYDPAAARRPPAWAQRPRFRRAVHHRQAGHLRPSRISDLDSPADLSAPQSRQFPCPWLQGGGHDDDPVRHGGVERARPLSPDGRCHRPAAAPRLHRRLRQAVHPRPADRAQCLHPEIRRGHARGARVALVARRADPPRRVTSAQIGWAPALP